MLVKGIGIIITCAGVMVLFVPATAKRMLSFWRRGRMLYLGGLVRIALGVVFLLDARQARAPALMAGLGVFAIIAGMLLFVLGLARIKAMLDWFEGKPSFVLRLMSIGIVAFGVLIIYAA